MKKQNFFLWLALAFFSLAAHADYVATERYTSMQNAISDNITVSATGFAIRSVTADGWLTPNGIVKELSDDCLWKAYSTDMYGFTTESGYSNYGFYSAGDKLCIQFNDLNGATSSKDGGTYVEFRAAGGWEDWAWFTSLPVDNESGEARAKSKDIEGAGELGQFVLCFETLSKGGVYTYMACDAEGGMPYYTADAEGNLWEFWAVEDKPLSQVLYEVIYKHFPYGVDTTIYSVGTNPGDLPFDVYEEALNTVNEAWQMMFSEDYTEDDYAEMITRIANVSAKVKSSFLPMREGYFLLHDQDNPWNWIYSSKASFSSTQSFSEPEVVTPEMAPYVWQVKKGAKDGTWYIFNVGSQGYAAAKDTQNGIAIQTDPDAWKITEASWGYASSEASKSFVPWGTFNIINDTYSKVLFCSWLNYIGTWANRDADPTLWQFIEVDPQQVDDIIGEIQNEIYLQQLIVLVKEAKATQSAALTYTSVASMDGKFDNVGIVTDASQLSSNAQEMSEGSFEALLDGDYSTYFHTAWNEESAPEDPTEFHYIQADLLEAMECVQIKYAKRATHPTQCNPTQFHVYATNNPDGEWVDQGFVNLSYNIDVDIYGTGSVTQGFAGLTGIEMDGAYRYIRLVCTDRVNGTSSETLNGVPFWYLSELHFYKAVFDEVNSPYYQVDADVREAFEKALADAEDVIADESCTQEQYDAFASAYDALLAQLPTPAALRAAYNKASAILAGEAPIGTEIGYYPEAAVSALENVLYDQTSNLENAAYLSREEIEEATQTLLTAIDDFYASMILPEVGDVFLVRAESTSTNAKSLLYSSSSAQSGALSVRPQVDGMDAVDYRSHYTYLWRVAERTAEGIVLQNYGTGMYLSTASEASDKIQQTLEPCHFQVKSSGIGGVVNFQVGDGLYLAQDRSYNVFAAASASGLDNSAFSIEVINTAQLDADGLFCWPVTDGRLRVMTLPVGVEEAENGTLFEVLGEKAGKLHLVEAKDGVAAGVPFVFLGETSDVTEAEFYLTDVVPAGDELIHVLQPLAKGGLQGTLSETVQAPVGAAVMYNENLAAITSETSTQLTTVGANSGYFDGQHAKDVEGEGAVQLDVPAVWDTDGISAILADAAARGEQVYTISGIRVSTSAKLPAGLYIVGGKKVLVK